MSSVSVTWAALGLSVVCSIAGQIWLKEGAAAPTLLRQFLAPRSLLGLAAYGFAALLYMRALRGLPISVALPATAVTYIGAAIAGVVLFGERLTIQQFLGIAMICGGVAFLSVNLDR